MKTIYFFKTAAVAVLFTLLFTSCGKDDLGIGRDGNGNYQTEEFTLPLFSEIDLKIDAEVFLTQGNEQKVVVEAEENILELINLDVKNRQWEIKFDKWVDEYDDIRIHITVPDLRKVVLSGSGLIKTENTFLVDEIQLRVHGSGKLVFDTEADRVDTHLAGNGNIELMGATDYLDSWIGGKGNLKAFDMLAKNAEITINGSGNAEVRVENFLKATIIGSGDVYYKGNPVLEKKITGSGKVVQLD